MPRTANEIPDHAFALLPAGPIPDGNTEMVECPGCGQILPTGRPPSSGYCEACYYLGITILRLIPRNRSAPLKKDAKARRALASALVQRAIRGHREREAYAWNSASKRDNATERPGLPFDTARQTPRLWEMNLEPGIAQDRPLAQFDDELHMRDESVIKIDGRCDYTDPPYTITWREEDD